MRRDGSILVLTAAAVVVLIGAGALVVDLGRALSARARQQASLDASATAASYALVTSTRDVAPTAVAWAARNGIAVDPNDVTCWKTADGSPGLTVKAHDTVPTLFAVAFGVSTMPIGTTSHVALGGVTELPAESAPFALEAYQDANKHWYGLTSASPPTFALMTANPNEGGPTPLLIKSKGAPVLAPEGDSEGNGQFQHTVLAGLGPGIVTGSSVALRRGDRNDISDDYVNERLNQGGTAAHVFVPLIAAKGHGESCGSGGEENQSAKIIGFVAAKLLPPVKRGEIVAEFETRVIAAHGKLGTGTSPGVYAPVMCMAPPAP